MPLETGMVVIREDNGNIKVEHDGKVYARASPVEFELDVPAPPTLEEAQAASEHYAGKIAHPAPHCFVCGPARATGDGLCIYPVRIPGRDYTAAPWMPDESLLDESGIIRPEFIWAALDCPGGLAAAGEPIKKVLLGRLAAKQLHSQLTLAPYVVIGWVIATEGRKHHTGSALFTTAGELCAYARAIWIGVGPR